MATSIDSVWAFVDKHLTHIALAVVLLIFWKTTKSKEPPADTQAEAAKQDVNARLSPPPEPDKDEDGKFDPLQEKEYWTKVKLHRSAVYATELYNAMHTHIGPLELGDFDGTDTKKILDVAYSIALARVPLSQLSADYLALQTKSAIFGNRFPLLDDLKSELSTTDYLKFMARIGLTPDQAQAELHPPKKASTKK